MKKGKRCLKGLHGEEVPEGVTPIRVFETAPGEYRPVQQIIQEAEDIYGPLTELCVKEGG